MQCMRLSRPGDEEQLKKLWETVFGDERQYIDTFFEYNYRPGGAMVMELDGVIISGIYMVPMGGMCFPDGSVLPASITYALATYPEHRGRGYGFGVMCAAIEHDFSRGYVCNSLCPAEDSLFPYYTSRIGYRDCFYLREAEISRSDLKPASGSAVPAVPSEYNSFRNSFLTGRLFMMFDGSGISYQKRLCTDTGGNLFMINASGFSGAACCEYLEDGTLFIKELLCPDEHILDALSILAGVLSGDRIILRTPADTGAALGGSVRRYGQMMRSDGNLDFTRVSNGYYGFGYD